MQKIILGNSYKLIKEIETNSVDLVLVDPPYDIKVKQGSGAFGVKKKLNYKQLESISESFDFSILDEFVRVLKKINIYIFCSQSQVLPLLKYFVEDKGCNWTQIDWCKDNVVPACNNRYASDKEICLFFRETGVKLYGTFKTKRTWYVTHTNVKDKRLYSHPTPKPLDIIRNFIINSTNEGDLVLDTFSGSGTTAVACKQLKRRCIAIEKEEKYFKSSIERLEAATALPVTNAEIATQQTLF